MATALLAPKTARIQLVEINVSNAKYRLVVEAADDLGFVIERHVWHGNDQEEGRRMIDAVRKTLGVIEGVRVEVVE